MEKSTSKTIVLTGYGGYDKLRIEEWPIMKPGKDEVLVNMRTNSINFAELMARQGLYDGSPKLPGVLGLEGAGIVTQLGEDVTNLKVGDRVICQKMFGLWKEFATVPADQCFPMPDAMSFEEGAAFPINYVTAYHMLFDIGNLRKGKKVVIHMAAGGVGIAATQLCKTVPNVTVFGTASSVKHKIISEVGVTHPIDYRTQDWQTEVTKVAPDGVDIILDSLLGSDATKAYATLKPLGKVIHFGVANMVTGPRPNYFQIAKTRWQTYRPAIMSMIYANKVVAGYDMGRLPQEYINEAMVDLIDLYNEGKIKPRIDSVWSYEQIADAMAQMHDRKNIGKVILTPYDANSIVPKT
ncbi:unnamed protein product [Owenia fusiformis]|uniref:Enoyl reductase (ER) domain-containing protein n=1 Tax=Owenia fusiformis TaxID=6347 RepID=A0A8S4P849_OWEFU|nr:unnamed protein product [Owenia fusiformis]